MKTDFVSLLAEARRRVDTSVLFERFISHTPLENDVAVWMANFAQEALEAAQREARETCGTCRHWRGYHLNHRRQSGECGMNVRFDVSMSVPYNFGCTLHEPLATPDVGSKEAPRGQTSDERGVGK